MNLAKMEKDDMKKTKRQVSTKLRDSEYSRLRFVSDKTDESMASIARRGIRREVKRMEREIEEGEMET